MTDSAHNLTTIRSILDEALALQKAGNLDDAFKALKEFAELVPDQYDVRLMLADQLVKASRKDEAIAQLLKNTSSDDILAQTLVDAANAAGGKDNISVILVRATGGRPKRSLLPRWWAR